MGARSDAVFMLYRLALGKDGELRLPESLVSELELLFGELNRQHLEAAIGCLLEQVDFLEALETQQAEFITFPDEIGASTFFYLAVVATRLSDEVANLSVDDDMSDALSWLGQFLYGMSYVHTESSRRPDHPAHETMKSSTVVMELDQRTSLTITPVGPAWPPHRNLN